MVGVEGIAEWIGREVVDRTGEKVGKLADVYFDTADDAAVFVAVKSGAFGRTVSVAPLEGATLSRDYVRLNAPKDIIKDAPSEDSGGRLTGVDALAVLAHFGLPPQPDLEGEERVCFQTAGAAAETERKRAEVEAEQARETAGAAAAGSVAAVEPPAVEPPPAEPLTPAPDAASVVPPADRTPDDDDPLARLAALERRVAALEARADHT